MTPAVRATVAIDVPAYLPKAAFTFGDVVDRVERRARDAMPLWTWGRQIAG